VHLLVTKPGFKTLISQVFMPDDPRLETDVQFGVTKHLIGNLVRHDEPPSGPATLEVPWYSMDYTFVLEPGESKLPVPPIK
jgi:catechol 1,2-dioxygenase